MKRWVIYKHTNKINGKSYIGQTCQRLTKRWQNGHGYTQLFKNAVDKYGWDNFDHFILEVDIETQEQANEREKYWIAYYHTFIRDPECNGYNLTAGGDGLSGYTLSEETKAKISKTLKKNKVFCKAVICIETGELFSSATDAQKVYGRVHIGECCRNERETAGGYHWAFLTDLDRQEELAQFKGKIILKEILCIETGEVFKTKTEAMLKYGRHVVECCNCKRQTTSGKHFQWIKPE